MSDNPIFDALLWENHRHTGGLILTLPRTLDYIALRKRLSRGVTSAEVRAMMAMPLVEYPHGVTINRRLLTGW